MDLLLFLLETPQECLQINHCGVILNTTPTFVYKDNYCELSVTAVCYQGSWRTGVHCNTRTSGLGFAPAIVNRKAFSSLQEAVTYEVDHLEMFKDIQSSYSKIKKSFESWLKESSAI